MKIVSFGEILFDIIENEPYLGGAPLNFAAHLARFGEDAHVLSRLGKDKLGRQAIEQIEVLGVKADFIQKDEIHPTGAVEILLKNGQPDYVIREEVAYDFIDYEVVRERLKEETFDVLYFGTLAQRNPISAMTLNKLVAENKFQQIFYDINLRKNTYTKEIIHTSLQACTILKLNDEEVQEVGEMFYQKHLPTEKFFRRLAKDFTIDVIIATAGERGCYIYNSGSSKFIKGYPASVVDAIGAGDAFSAAFIFEYLKHADVKKAAELANRLGAFVAGSRGAIPQYAPEIKQMLGLE